MSLGPSLQNVESGKLRVLAAATPKRMPYVTDVPTFAELGFPGLEASTWFSRSRRSGTPKDIVEQLNGYTRGLYDDAELKTVETAYVDPLILTQPGIRRVVKADAVKWERLVREAGHQDRMSYGS